jgi:hypothetical protein
MARWYPVFAVSGISLQSACISCISLQSAGISLNQPDTGIPVFRSSFDWTRA